MENMFSLENKVSLHKGAQKIYYASTWLTTKYLFEYCKCDDVLSDLAAKLLFGVFFVT